MCGIAGIFHLDGSPIQVHQLRAMTQIIRHRGPDDEGFLLAHTEAGQSSAHWSSDSISEIKSKLEPLPTTTQCNLGIGFRRLAIIDLTAGGHQPLCDESKNYYLTFNGQIYNYLEIKNELLALGVHFNTVSDTEVLLKSYIQWGVKCLDRLIGMFAFVIYDKTNKCLFAARDRLGVKPFVYTYDNQRFIWASEEKQLICSKLVTPQVNESVMVHFLRNVSLFESQETFFKEIHQLPPASYALVNTKGISIHKYWHLQLDEDIEQLPFGAAKEKTKSLLEDAVKLRLRSDVPLGIALSGGIDSSSISCVARNLSPGILRTFSVYYEGKKFDERAYIQAVINTGGFDPVFYTGDQHCTVDQINQWIFHQDAPTAGGSPFAAYQNYRNVRSAGITVLLNGQGGDELFAGYPYYLKYLLAQQIKSKQHQAALENLWKIALAQGPMNGLKQLFLSWKVLSGKMDLLRQLEYQKYATANLYPEEFPYVMEGTIPTNYFKQALLNGITRTHLPHMLRWEDRNSMAHSVESRVPFLDHRLVEFAYSLPDHYKIQGGIQKFILRDAMHSVVPEQILKRTDKIGFATPTDQWTSGILKNAIHELLNDPLFRTRTWIYGNRVLKKMKESPESFGQHELWRIINAELWHRRFIDQIS